MISLDELAAEIRRLEAFEQKVKDKLAWKRKMMGEASSNYNYAHNNGLSARANEAQHQMSVLYREITVLEDLFEPS